MQRFKVDLQRPSAPLVVYAKQGDTARRVEIELYDNGQPFNPPESVVAAVFYKTAAGEGNYTENVTITGNKIDLILIQQMLVNAGNGAMCVVMTDTGGVQLGLWNLEVHIEGVPGMGSSAAGEWYSALAEYVAQSLKNVQDAKAQADEAKKQAEAAAESAKLAEGNAHFGEIYEDQLAGSTVKSGALVTANLTEDAPLHVVSKFEPQGGGGTPEAPIPIEGVTGLSLTRCGENLLDPNWAVSGYGVTVSVDDGDLVFNGAPTNDYAYWLKIKPLTIPDGKITLYQSQKKAHPYLFVHAKSKLGQPAQHYTPFDTGYTTFVCDNNKWEYSLDISIPAKDGITFDNLRIRYGMYFGDAQLTKAYSGHTYTADFGRTVYGRAVYAGTFDWQSGKLKSSVYLTSPPTKTLQIINQEKVIRVITTYLDKGADYEKTHLAVCSHFSYDQSDKEYPHFNMLYSKLAFYILKSDLDAIGAKYDESGYQAWLADQEAKGTPVKVAYHLRDTTTTQLTPQQIPALSGVNNIFADTGTVDVSRQRVYPPYLVGLDDLPHDGLTFGERGVSYYYVKDGMCYVCISQVNSPAEVKVIKNLPKAKLRGHMVLFSIQDGSSKFAYIEQGSTDLQIWPNCVRCSGSMAYPVVENPTVKE